nr:GAF domain-containing protein [Fulvimarina endophytica]
MGPEPEREFDRVTALVRRLLDVPVAYLTLAGNRRKTVDPEAGFEEAWSQMLEAPSNRALCERVTRSGEVVVIADMSWDGWVRAEPATGEMSVRAFIGVPLRLSSGNVIGSLCAMDTRVRDWSADDLSLMQDFSEIIMREVALRTEVERRKAAEEETRLVARELQHRSRNAFSILQAVISLSMRDAGLTSLKLEIIDRISSVAATQELIAESEGGTILLDAILARELAPFTSPDRYDAWGPPVEVTANEAVFLSMIIHELATNAVKYGALRSSSKGRLDLSWDKEPGDEEKLLSLEWRESGLDLAAAQPSGNEPRGGFGSELLDILVMNQLRGSIERMAKPDGLTIALELRLSRPFKPAPGVSSTEQSDSRESA